jgi:hypothetical protein
MAPRWRGIPAARGPPHPAEARRPGSRLFSPAAGEKFWEKFGEREKAVKKWEKIWLVGLEPTAKIKVNCWNVGI